MALRPRSCRTTCGSWSSRSCRRRSGAFAIRAVGGCPNGRRCTGSCSCCTPGSRGRTCRASWASVRGVAEGRVWVELHEVLLTRLRAAGEIEWSRAVVDSSHVQAKKGCRDRAEPGGQRPRRLQAPSPCRCDRHPTRVVGHRWQPQQRHPADPLVDAVPAVRGTVGRPRKRPERLTADRGYDHDKYRSQLRQRGIRPEIARRGRPSTARA